MGTRGFVGFIIDDSEKISYNHQDSYPSYVGVHLLKWLRGQMDAGHLATMAEQARAIQLVDEEAKPADSTETWYEVLHDDQGDLGASLERGMMADFHQFPLDSLSCAWGYLVDLATGRFEAYRGMQTTVPANGRWAGRPTVAENQANHTLFLEWCAKHERMPWLPETPEYKAVELVGSWSLSALPTEDEFMKEIG